MEALLIILVGLALTTFICSGSGCYVGVMCTSVLLHVVFWGYWNGFSFVKLLRVWKENATNPVWWQTKDKGYFYSEGVKTPINPERLP